MLTKRDLFIKNFLKYNGEPCPQERREQRLTTRNKYDNARWIMSCLNALAYRSDQVHRIVDFDLRKLSNKIKIRLFVPTARSSSTCLTPAFVYYRGASADADDRDTYDALLPLIANCVGCLVFSVDYGFNSKSYDFADTEDPLIALSWIVDRALKIGVDLDQLAVGGDSVGGLLAAWVAQRGNEIGIPLRLQVLFYPQFDRVISSALWKLLRPEEYVISHIQMLEWYNALLSKGLNQEGQSSSPLFAADLTDVAPALILSANLDTPYDDGEAYVNKLRSANVSVDQAYWPDISYDFAAVQVAIDSGNAVIEKTVAALHKAFALEI